MLEKTNTKKRRDFQALDMFINMAHLLFYNMQTSTSFDIFNELLQIIIITSAEVDPILKQIGKDYAIKRKACPSWILKLSQIYG